LPVASCQSPVASFQFPVPGPQFDDNGSGVITADFTALFRATSLSTGNWRLETGNWPLATENQDCINLRSVSSRCRPDGFTLIELLVVMAIVALLATVAMVGYRYARVRSQEAAIITSITAINQAQFAYMQSCGGQRYAPTLVSLGAPVPGSEQGFVSPDLAVSDPLEKSGYLLQMTGTESTDGEQTCTGAVPLERYRLTADPIHPSDSARFFGTNTDRVIYADAATFIENMPETGPPGHGAEIR
jgi:prepilin-type N-terminal cleavage/methylation domain-containing protein